MEPTEVIPNSEFKDLDYPSKSNSIGQLSLTPKQLQFINAYVDGNYTLSEAIHRSGIATGTYYRWKSEYPHFRRAIEIVRERLVDLAEDGLKELLVMKDPKAIMFVLKTLGKDRGYTEKQELEVSQINGIEISFNDNNLIEEKQNE